MREAEEEGINRPGKAEEEYDVEYRGPRGLSLRLCFLRPPLRVSGQGGHLRFGCCRRQTKIGWRRPARAAREDGK